MLVVVREDLGLDFLRTEFVEFFLDGFGSGVGVIATHVDSAACLSYLAAHVFVQLRNDHVSLPIFDEVIRARHRDGRTFGFTDTDHENLYAFFLGALGYGYGIVFVVLTVGDEDDGTARVALLSKATDRGIQGCTDGGTLGLDEVRLDGIEEHLRRYIVTGDRQLDERVTGEDHESYLVVYHVIHQLGQHLFGAVQTVRRHVFRHHRVGDIEGYDGFDTLPFLRALGLTELRTGRGDDE